MKVAACTAANASLDVIGNTTDPLAFVFERVNVSDLVFGFARNAARMLAKFCGWFRIALVVASAIVFDAGCKLS